MLYEHQQAIIKDCKDSKLFVVVQKNPEGLRILKIYTDFDAAQKLLRKIKYTEVITYSNSMKSYQFFSVFVISVGKGKSYRIIDIVFDKKKAIKIATSVNGLVSTHKVGPKDFNPTQKEFYKYWVNLDGEDCNTLEYRGTDTRIVTSIPGNNIFSILTHRRRYLDSMPARLEIFGLIRQDAEDIAKQYVHLSLKEAIELFEYNTDYSLDLIDGKWQIVQGELV